MNGWKRVAAIAAVCVTAIGATAAPAWAGDAIWQMYGSNAAGGAQHSFVWGDVPAGCLAIPGDWDGNGTDTPGITCPVGEIWTWFLQNQNDNSATEHWYNWGSRSCLPMAGDWDGNGTDTPGQVCGGAAQWRWQYTNVHGASGVAVDFLWGEAAGCWPIPGDWDGNGTDTPGTVCPTAGGWMWRQHNTSTTAGPTTEFTWGSTTNCQPVWGDWNGDRTQTPGVTCAGPNDVEYRWQLHNANAAGGVEHDFRWGFSGRTRLVGDWNGDGITTPGATSVASPSSLWQTVNLRGGGNPVFARPSYDYAPTAMLDGVYRMWWCGGVAGDYILYAEASSPGGPWHARGSSAPNTSNVVFGPRNGTGAFDNLHTCDPSVVRVNATYYMYYGALKAGPGEPTTMGVASSVDGLNWTRLNGGNPIVVPVRSVLTVPNGYGAGQPSVTFVEGKFYLIYTDTTGYAVDGNGGGQFILRSSDPAFQTGVEELTADGFAPRTAANHTRFALFSAFSVDWQYVDHLKAFLVAQHTSSGVTIFRTYDKSLRHEVAPPFTVPQNWHEGPGLISRPDKHAVPSAWCGVVPIDYVHAVGPGDVNTWDLAHRGFDLTTGRSCQDSNLAATFEGYQLHSAGLPLATVVGGLRLQWAQFGPVTWMSRNSLQVSSDTYHSVPYGGSVHAGQQVLGAAGRPAAFNVEGRLWPVDCLELITSNGSQITLISQAEWDAYPKGPDLRCLR